MSLFKREFWVDAAERSLKTAAQFAIVAGVGAVGFNALSADWVTIGGASLGGAVLSLLTSIASSAATGNLASASVRPHHSSNDREEI